MKALITLETEASSDTELGVGASRIKHVSFFNFSDCWNTLKYLSNIDMTILQPAVIHSNAALSILHNHISLPTYIFSISLT